MGLIRLTSLLYGGLSLLYSGLSLLLLTLSLISLGLLLLMGLLEKALMPPRLSLSYLRYSLRSKISGISPPLGGVRYLYKYNNNTCNHVLCVHVLACMCGCVHAHMRVAYTDTDTHKIITIIPLPFNFLPEVDTYGHHITKNLPHYRLPSITHLLVKCTTHQHDSHMVFTKNVFFHLATNAINNITH